MKFTIKQYSGVAFALIAAVLIFVFIVSYRNSTSAIRSFEWVEHTQDVLRELSNLRRELKEAESGPRRHVLTGRSEYLREYEIASRNVSEVLSELKRSTADNPSQQRRLSELEMLIAETASIADEVINVHKMGHVNAAVQMLQEDKDRYIRQEMARLTAELENDERRLLTQRKENVKNGARMAMIAFVGGIALNVLVLGIVYFLITREINRRMASAEALKENERRLGTVLEITSRSGFSIEEKIDWLLRAGARQLTLDNALVVKVDGDQSQIQYVVSAKDRFKAGFVCGISDTFASEVVRNRQPLAFEHAGNSDWRNRSAYRQFGSEAYIGAPVFADGELYGVLCFTSTTPRNQKFSSSDIEFVRLMAQWIGGEIEREMADQALRESEDRYKQLVQHANDIIYRTDSTGHFTYVSPVAERLLNYSQESLLDHHYLELIHPDNRKEAARFYGEQFDEKVQSTYYEFPAVKEDGATVWIGQNVQLIIENGQVTGAQAVARDITTRRLLAADLELARD